MAIQFGVVVDYILAVLKVPPRCRRRSACLRKLKSPPRRRLGTSAVLRERETLPSAHQVIRTAWASISSATHVGDIAHTVTRILLTAAEAGHMLQFGAAPLHPMPVI